MGSLGSLSLGNSLGFNLLSAACPSLALVLSATSKSTSQLEIVQRLNTRSPRSKNIGTLLFYQEYHSKIVLRRSIRGFHTPKYPLQDTQGEVEI